MKKESSKSPTTQRNYVEVDPKERLDKEIIKIFQEIKSLTDTVDNIKDSFSTDLKKSLNEKVFVKKK